MTRATIVLELQNNTPLYATVSQQGRVGRVCQSSLLEDAGDVYVDTVSTGRWADASDDGIACLELQF
jgi:hypothetical protein